MSNPGGVAHKALINRAKFFLERVGKPDIYTEYRIGASYHRHHFVDVVGFTLSHRMDEAIAVECGQVENGKMCDLIKHGFLAVFHYPYSRPLYKRKLCKRCERDYPKIFLPQVSPDMSSKIDRALHIMSFFKKIKSIS